MDSPRSWSRAQAWLATFTTALLAFGFGVLLAPELVWDRFLWHYFWGPVYADANNAVCVVMDGGTTELFYSTVACQDASGIVAEPGYTLVSEAGYAISLVFFLVGVLTLLHRLEIGDTKQLFFALVPFMFFGGALRVIEDANDSIPEGAAQILAYPWNTLIISPIIYFTVFFITLATVVASVLAERRGYVERYGRQLFATGWVLVLCSVGYLLYFVPTRLTGTVDGAGFYPQVTGVTVGLSVLFAVSIYRLAQRYKPGINAGTGYVGLVVIFGHAIDGVANVIAADWTGELGVVDSAGNALQYGAKHPFNDIIVGVVDAIQPAGLDSVIGLSWGFLVVKLVAATAVVWVFDDTIFDDEPRYAILLLVAILAVGLGPGTRDMLRVTFGI
ncbi:DUF63 family protein [Halosegnis longus]|uniref:DUF63 family protein n=1 Tax=Halosegnis longus TaxID=2216012 RepID=A0AAJ4R8M7_9EURY|nr:DUF63 family protein [Halosegnis longus]RNJ26247.1 DUF63 family protein [Salella cibi]